MMQQQQTQEQAMSGQQQQLGQQMVLCPVRVVYETQILVPPGEQYQPNQTIFLNPQNPPPWANQNTQQAVVPQNQMLYVQQMPNNMAPSVQPMMDQNQQMYIQQAFPNMQSVIQNQNLAMMQQNQQDRQILRQPIQTIQFPNVPPDINTINMNYAQMINAQNMNNIVHNIPNMQQTQIIGQGMQNMQVNMQQMMQQVPQMQQQRPQMQQIQQPMQQQQLIRAPMIMQQNQQRPMNVQQTQLVRAPQQNIVNVQPNMVVNSMQTVQNNVQNNQQQINKPQQQQVNNIRPPQNVQQVRHNLPQQVMMPKPHVIQNINQNVPRNNPPNYVQHNQVQLNQGQLNQAQHNQAQHNQAQHSQAQHNQAQHNQAQHNQPQHNQAQHNQAQHNQAQQNQAQHNQARQMASTVSTAYMNQPNNVMTSVNIPKMVNNKVAIPNMSQVNTQLRARVQNPQAVRHMMPQLRPMPPNFVQNQAPNQVQTQSMGTQYIRPVQRFINPDMSKVQQQNQKPMPQPTQPINDNLNRNNVGTDTRKRKSESPDETKAKITMNSSTQVSMPMIRNNSQFVNNMQKVTNINNAQPTSAPNNKPVIPNQNNNQTAKVEPYMGNVIQIQSYVPQSVSLPQNTSAKPLDSQDKLHRNTVYAQARSRNTSNLQGIGDQISIEVINKEAITQAIPTNITNLPSTSVKMPINAPSMVNTSHIPVNISNILSHSVNIPATSSHNISKSAYQPTKMVTETPVQIKMEVTESVSDNKLIINESTDIKTFVIKKEADKIKIESMEVVKEVPLVKEVVKEVKKEVKPNVIDEKIKNINSICGKELELSHGNKKSEKDNSFILTHVLDGIVIQESNIAFPIRIPLKEKSILPNPPAVKDEVTKKETLPAPTEVKTEAPKGGDNKIMTISKLNIDENESNMANNVEDNPFSALKTQTVKSWTSEDLEKHLTDSWRETASILREHEIDGEALFLVSTAQLLEIGINENHADILSEFVKS